MGWQNPPIPWRELERRLAGRPVPAGSPAEPAGPDGDGGDSVAWSRHRPPYEAKPLARPTRVVPYAELHAHSSFSHLDGASLPEELVEQAVACGLTGLALTDHNGMYGVPRFAEAAQSHGLAAMYGAELSLDIPVPTTNAERSTSARAGAPDPPGRHLLVLARDPAGYASLCRAISLAQRRGGAKGRPVYDLDELTELAAGRWLVLTGCRKGSVRQALESGALGSFALDPARRALDELVARFGRDNVVVELSHARDPLADERYDALTRLADEQRLPVVATTAAHYHGSSRRPLATAMAAVRARRSLAELDGWLPSWADQALRTGEEMAQRFARWPGAVETAARLGEELAFPIQLIAPDLPPFPVPAGHTEMTYLRELTMKGAANRYGPRRPESEKAYVQIEHELAVIEELRFPGYFLVVWDIVRFARESGILCQGRGSAACSAVCYALEITAVDAVLYGLLFERFLAAARNEPPDIDVDIESGRREEVIQYVYDRHGRDHAAQVANVITYRPRSALRDVAKALGYSTGQQDAWSKQIEHGFDATTVEGVPPKVLELAQELRNTPRHLGIHSGGMVICDRPIIEVCPVEWGRMPGRTVLQWDKDDCAAIGLVKFDLLGLGMLSALRYSFELIADWHGVTYDLDAIPKESPCVYDMVCKADTVGVFQIESRAQMATLPRLRPRNFYDLAVEVALIRPGPIQGDSVHPYIRRRHGREPVSYPHPILEDALKRTLGIPLFQEQLMQVAVAAANFTPSEADQLRRAMGAKRSDARIDALRQRLYDGMADNGITGAAADEIVDKIKAFAAFGFAESHAISFALLVYASSWLKLHYPAAFCAALINAQPMGFYSPQSLVADARRHGVETRKPDINISSAGATLEAGEGASQCPCLEAPQPAVRLGLSSVRTIGDDLAKQIVAVREAGGPYTSMADLSHRVGCTTAQVEALATAGVFDGFGVARRDALWAAGAAAAVRPGQFDLATVDELATPDLPMMTEPEQLIADLWATGVTAQTYPTALVRDRLDSLGIVTALGLRSMADRTRVTVGGVVTHRQRPATARGVTFVNLEDETGMINVICSMQIWTRYRKIARGSAALLIRGMLQHTDGVVNVMAERIAPLSLGVRPSARNFR
ncbi:MAG TPA: error-prone DNA polymerase [Mycobacteriales bacterium]|jgi:error-prone DNA polymerase|nr:error-prone DNA polymerase [Mycobacteriales bacterium]